MNTHPVCCHYKTDAILWVIKVAISEFGLLMLMVILLNHYMFIKVIISGFKANKMHFLPHCFLYKQH